METNQTRGADFNWHEAYSCDFTTFVQADAGRTENGKTLYAFYSYTLENPDNKKALLTARNDRYEVVLIDATETPVERPKRGSEIGIPARKSDTR